MNDDLISREALKKAINTYDKFACLPNGKLEPIRNLEHPEMFEEYVHFRDIIKCIDNAPTEERPQDKKIEAIIEELESRKDYGTEYAQAMEDVIVILKAQFGIEKEVETND